MQLGRYEVIRKLGEGGMAHVLLARSANGERVVLKVPRTDDADFAERLRDEARVGLRVQHPSVVDTLDLFEHEGRPILVVAYVEGASLQQIRRQAGAMPPGLVARVGRQVAEGLAFLHEATDEREQPLHILHRDVTPGNILVTREGNAKLIDLGIARGAETRAKKTQTGTVRGTLRYLAPELLTGAPHAPATDLWALGVVLFEAALGRRAVDGDEREVLAAITRGDLGALRPGETLDDTLRDGIFALLAPRDSRLQRARAAVNVWKRIEGLLSVDEAWCQRVVADALARQEARWAAEKASPFLLPPLESTSSPAVASSAADDDEEQRTAVTLPSSAGEPPLPLPVQTALASESPSPTTANPRPRVSPDEELAHLDGIAPTVQMTAMELEALAPGAPTELMAAVDPLPGAPTEVMPAVNPMMTAPSETPVADAIPSFEETQKFPRPGPADSPLAPDQSAPLAWRSVAAPSLLGLAAAQLTPPGALPSGNASSSRFGSPPSPAPTVPSFGFVSSREPSGSEPIIAAEPDEKTEAGAPPPRPPSGWANAPVSEPPRPATNISREISGPLPRMLRVEEAFRNDTDLALPAAPIAPLRTQEDPEAAALPEAQSPPRPAHEGLSTGSEKPVDPSHRPPDPRALGIPTPTALEAVRAGTPSDALRPEEATETAFALDPSVEPEPVTVRTPDAMPPRAPAPAVPAAAAPAAPSPAAPSPAAPVARPPAATEPAMAPPTLAPIEKESFENTDRTVRMPPAPRAGFIGQRANPEDATERVPRWKEGAGLEHAAAGFEEPLLSGELEWKPNRTKHIALAAAVAIAVAVATVVVLLLLS